MSIFKLPYITTAQRTILVLQARELVFDTDLNQVFRGDGATLGGVSFIGASWGSITGSIGLQTDLQTALGLKQATLASGTNIKTINGSTILGSGDLVVTAAGTDISYVASTRALSSSTGAGTTLPLFTSTEPGLTPLSGGGTTNFLRADGTWSAPSGGGGVSDGDKGDITVSGAGAVWTVDNAAISLAKMADVATATVFYRKTAATGVPEVQTLATLKTDLGLAGTNNGDQTITLTADVTGSGTGSFAATIAADAVTNTKLANMAANSFKINNTGAAADPIDGTVAQVKTLLAYTPADIGAATSAQANATHTGDATGATALTIAANAVDNTKAADMATARIKGRVTAATGDPEDLTGTQATTLLDTFTSALKGLVPASGGGTANFLRADGTFAAPAGGGDMVLASAQTNTALKTFLDGTFGLRNVANTFTALFTNTITTARTYTLKDASGTLAFTSDITGTNSGTNTGDQTITLTGDLTGSGTGSFATTLATVNANTGSWGLAASVAQFTVNAKGLITAAANVAISIASTAISDSTAAGRAFLTAATATAQTALLDLATTSVKGLAPVRSGVATEYLNGAGAYTVPAGGGGSSGPSIGLSLALSAGAFNL